MRRLRPARRPRLALVLTVALVSTLAGAPAALADPLSPPSQAETLGIIGDGRAAFYFYPSSQTIEVRLTGKIPASLRVTGTWEAVITGHRRATTTSAPEPVYQPWADPNYEVAVSFFFPKSGVDGSLTVDFSYTAAGEYVLVHSLHTLEWNPVTGMNTVGQDLG